MSKYFFIKDNIEKEIEIDLEDFETQRQNKKEFIKDNDELNSEIEIYNIATVSDKEINRRIYPHEYVIKTVMDGGWIKPFNKPLLKNHDEMTEPLGRVVDSFYVNHSDKKCIATSGLGIIPNEVIEDLTNKGMLEKGTGSVILKMIADSVTLEKIKNGIYLTTSQGSVTDAMNCSICGKPISKCEHMPGKEYNNERCLIITGNLRPVENSIVNAPANDTSIFVVYNKITKKIIDSLQILKDNESNKKINIKDNANQSEVEKNIMNPEKIQKLVKILKDNQIKKVKEFFGENEKINNIFDSYELEDLEQLIEITDTFLEFGQNKINDKITELQKIIEEKDSTISDLSSQVSELELKLTDLENIEPEPTETPVQTPEVPEPVIPEPIVPEIPEPVIPEPIEPEIKKDEVPEPIVPEIKEEEKEKAKDLEEPEENGKVEKIKDNFTNYKLKKQEKKDNSEIVKDFFINQKNIINTF